MRSQIKLYFVFVFEIGVMAFFMTATVRADIKSSWEDDTPHYKGATEEQPAFWGKLADFAKPGQPKYQGAWQLRFWDAEIDYVEQPKPKECCFDVETKVLGTSTTLALEKQKLSMKWSGWYWLTPWQDRDDYGNRCQSAGAEWDRVFEDTKNHEFHHNTMHKDYLTEERVQQRMSGVLSTFTSKCHKTWAEVEGEWKDYKDNARIDANKIRDQLITEAEEQDNTDTIWPYKIPDPAKDCPDVPLNQAE